jgi:hypothetical protein
MVVSAHVLCANGHIEASTWVMAVSVAAAGFFGAQVASYMTNGKPNTGVRDPGGNVNVMEKPN